MIRDLLRRSRAANNPKSLLRWTTAFVRFHPQLVCNGFHSLSGEPKR